MNKTLSVVITCKNAEAHINATLQTVLPLSNDIVLYDTGSTDKTLEIAKNFAVKIFNGLWEGFGTSRNKTLAKAAHDWVLVIDADEAVDETLQAEIMHLNLDIENTVYAVSIKNFLGHQQLKWGDWGADCRIRLFNKQQVRWDDSIVHEQLLLPSDVKVKKLQGSILHRNAANVQEYSRKLRWYALLTAEKYYSLNRKATWVRRYFSASYTFIRIYFFRGGFLDGWNGFVVAQSVAYYTFLKYARLHELWKNDSSG